MHLANKGLIIRLKKLKGFDILYFSNGSHGTGCLAQSDISKYTYVFTVLFIMDSILVATYIDNKKHVSGSF